MRAWELALVLTVALGGPLITSTWYWWTGSTKEATAHTIVLAIEGQLASLAILVYVLARRHRTLRHLGLTWRWIEIPAGILLLVAGILAHQGAGRLLRSLERLVDSHSIAAPVHHASITGGTLIALYFLYAIIDPIKEELTVRAFAMTEIEALTGSMGVAIAASTLLQTLYHLYLGAHSALTVGALFLLYSCFYARFRRITPIILCHVLWDLIYVWNHV